MHCVLFLIVFSSVSIAKSLGIKINVITAFV